MNRSELHCYIKDNIVVSSRQIIQYFVSQGKTNTSVRKSISRLKDPFRSVSKIHLANKAKIFYHKAFWKTPDYCEKLTKILLEEHSVYGYALEALRAKSGFIVEKDFPIICGSGNQKGHIPPELIKQNLLDSGLLSSINIEAMGTYLYLSAYNNISVQADETMRIIQLKLLQDWLKKLNFVSFKKNIYRTSLDGSPPQFVSTFWDLTGPSYLYPLLGNKIPKQGSIVCDLFLNSIVSSSQIQYYLNKLEMLKKCRNIPKFLPIILAPSFETDTFSILRNKGIIVATYSNLYGEETAKLFAELYTSLKNLAAAITKDPQKMYELFDKLSTFEGISNQIRGPLFEMICVHLAQNTFSAQFIENSKHITSNDKEKELDVFAQNSSEFIIIECKGYLPNHKVNAEEISEWLKDTIPFVRKTLLQKDPQNNGKKFLFNFWTTSDFDEKAIELLTSVTIKNNVEIHWKNGKDVLKLAKEKKLHGVIKTLNEYYFKNFLDKMLY